MLVPSRFSNSPRFSDFTATTFMSPVFMVAECTLPKPPVPINFFVDMSTSSQTEPDILRAPGAAVQGTQSSTILQWGMRSRDYTGLSDYSIAWYERDCLFIVVMTPSAGAGY